jgi:hypothetical protein
MASSDASIAIALAAQFDLQSTRLLTSPCRLADAWFVAIYRDVRATMRLLGMQTDFCQSAVRQFCADWRG